MPNQACQGGVLKCPFGSAPGVFNVLPIHRVTAVQPAANILDNKPLVNIPSFGMCSALSNPAVAAATAAAMGALTPQPCMPVVPAPWVPGNPTVLINNIPALTDACQCACAWGGMISFVNAGQMTVVES